MDFYNQIFKRKSFHLFSDPGRITLEDMEAIKAFSKSVAPLYPDIKISVKIVPESETTCKRGAEYCLLFYSEKKGEYLRNIGYIGEQFDLYFASRNIGALWYGIGKPEQMFIDGLDFVIMPADKVLYYNRIDIGIFLFLLDICLEHEGISFKKELYNENADDSVEKVVIAKYKLA